MSGGKNRGPGGIEWFDDPDNPTYRYTSEGPVSRRGAGASVALTVSNLKTGSAVFIDEFYNGDLGIELDDGKKKPSLPGMAEPSRPATPARNPGSANRGDPLVIDLTGAGLGASATLGLGAGVHMDLDGDRFAETTGWVSTSAGLLVIDRAATGNPAVGGAGSASDAPDGLLSDGQELFGDYTRLNGGQLAANGFQALSQHDRNRDGVIDARDVVWSQLRVATWGTNPHTGAALIGGDPGSAMVLAPLADFGIKAIHLANTLIEQPMADANGNTKTRQTVVEYTDGRTSVNSASNAASRAG